MQWRNAASLAGLSRQLCWAAEPHDSPGNVAQLQRSLRAGPHINFCGADSCQSSEVPTMPASSCSAQWFPPVFQNENCTCLCNIVLLTAMVTACGTSMVMETSSADMAVTWRSMSATAPQLYSHVGTSGEAFWSPVPPNSTCESTPPPIYYEPMCVEEPSPEPDPRISRSASRAARMVGPVMHHEPCSMHAWETHVILSVFDMPTQ